MIVDRPGMALELLAVFQSFNFSLDRLVLDLAIGLPQPVAVGVDALLGGFAVLPYLIALRHLGHAQAVGQDRLDERLALYYSQVQYDTRRECACANV